MYKHTVFISYSRKDIDVAHQLAQDLEKAGFDAWWDISDLKGGDAWVRTIQAALKASKYCVVVLSPDAVESEWIEKEYTYAIGLGLRIIPILYKKCEVPMALANIQYIDFRRKKYERGLQELLEILRVLAPDEEGAQPGPVEGPHPAVRRAPAQQVPKFKGEIPTWAWIASAAVLIICLVAVGVMALLKGSALLEGKTAAWQHTPAPTATDTPTNTPTNTLVPSTDTPMPVPPTDTPPPAPQGMVYVPAGEFTMGSNEGGSDEQPVHKVYLDAFYIDPYEVTNAQYVRFLNTLRDHKGQCKGHDCIETKNEDDASHILYQGGQYVVESGYEEHPVIEVSWYGAKSYCEHQDKRLPTEAEWEKAARGIDGRMYPWGEGIDCDHAHYEECDGETVPAGSKPSGVSPYGALDMAGNVREWVADWYQSYPGSTSQSEYFGEKLKVKRGGSWNFSKGGVRCSARAWGTPRGMLDDVGFRCARGSQ